MTEREVITSTTNPKIKAAAKLQQKKYRTQTGLFLLEGYKPIEEACTADVDIQCVYTTEKYLQKFDFIKDKVILVTQPVLEKISTTESMSEAVAVAKQKEYTLDSIKNAKKIALIENIKDAGNLGTLIRSACAFSFDAICLCADSVDVYNPKVIRSTVGALFKLPVIKTSLKELKELFPSHTFIASVLNHKDIVTPETIDYTQPFVLMLGSEADGLTKEAIDAADLKTTIPISSKTESLNLSTAGSILFYISSRK